MIKSAEEFILLRNSETHDEYMRAAYENASDLVWIDVISRFPEMREWVAYNKTVPLNILETLARDKNESVRATVAMKRKLSPELFDLLSRDNSEEVRHRIACNKKTPIYILKMLTNDPIMFVREAALKHVVN
ncbi:hypothetical protein MMP65_13150 [Acinetobacter sp. ANC 3926]|uniref:Leucine rich repeat variant n=1 Tax=Acinetobacter genomosp. 15BJ TaxID=106651 RepID=R9B5I6_9GAMM|nr:hypothetical protein [Acinetobacter genomosp. 15BJ]EOR09703.1 hypothetical protein F896_00725 [Acinetobacter genomosp. 15BJ]MCH7292400.1 hypothetical protein [Acinetobacter genomosp. 15BJ]